MIAENKNLRWIYLGVLSLIWGSSFILMKKALVSLTPIQVGALRIIFTAIFLILIGFKSIFKINRKQWFYLTLNGLVGTFFPVFLFAYAIQKIDSSVASILNSLTPLNTLIIGALVFGIGFRRKQLIGVLIGLVGTLMLILNGAEVNPNQDYFYSSFILIASIGYALNVNILKKYLHDLNALSITVGNFVIIVIPAIIVLFISGFFNSFQLNDTNKDAILFVIILAVFCTGFAKIMFNRLIQISTPIFSSSVTYLIPIVAITWGIFDGEKITLYQFLSGGIIMLGVYLVNKSKIKTA